MAIDIRALDSGVPIHNGYAVVGENTINYYQSFPTMSGMVDDGILHKPVIADIEEKYTDRFDDPTYY